MMVKIKNTVSLFMVMATALSCRFDGGNFQGYAISDKESSKGNTVVSYSLLKIVPINEWGAVFHYRALCTRPSANDGHLFSTTDSATIFSPGMGIILINGHQ